VPKLPTVNYTFHQRRNLQSGAQYSAVIDVPASEGDLFAVIDATNITGPGQELKLTVLISRDGGVTFEGWATMTANSEPRNTKGDPLKPQFQLPFKFDTPVKAQCLIEVINGPFQVGVEGRVVFV